jgi:hypothetical protein
MAYVELEQNGGNHPGTSRRKICMYLGLVFLGISIIVYTVLTPYSASVGCPNCNVFCEKCNCNAINGTQAQLNICEKCATCVASECSNFKHDLSSNFAEIFWWTGWVSLFVAIINSGPERR